MKYIRTYETEEKFLTDKDSTSRVFRLKPTLYKYSEAGDHVHLELDDPRKHGDSTWIRLEFTKATEFSFKISNVTGDDSNTLNYTIDWSDGTVETNTATRGDDKLYTFSHSYAIGTYDVELYGTDRSYRLVSGNSESYFVPTTAVKRVVIGSNVEIDGGVFSRCSKLTSINIPEGVTSIGDMAFVGCSSLTSINIPEGVTSIGDWTFNNCSSLTSISSYNTTAPTLGTKNVFTSMPSNGTLHIKPGATGYDAWLSKLPSGWTIVEDL